MLEDKKLVNCPKWTKRTFTGNGHGGVEAFIKSVTEPKANYRKVYKKRNTSLAKGKVAFSYKSGIINPLKLDISKIAANTKSICTVKKNKGI